jgi:hypothetical protein
MRIIVTGANSAGHSALLEGIRCVDPIARAPWKATLAWWTGGRLTATKHGEAVWRKIAPFEARLMRATRGRVRISVAAPVVVLTSTGARSGNRRGTPLAYFTDRDDVILIASNYGGKRHPDWYHNL